MNDWTALVPLKGGIDRKSRLSAILDQNERAALSDYMMAGVVDCLGSCPEIGRIILLSARCPTEEHDWRADQGRGLNAEIQAAREDIAGPMLVIHADLPLSSGDDIRCLLEAAKKAGLALAPDRHGEGTNAIALAGPSPFQFSFGVGSFAAHKAIAVNGAIVVRDGLGIDVDTPEDLETAERAGFDWRASIAIRRQN